jgi:prolyl-tRNA synthetase
VSTRLVGAVIMTHGDDKGLRLPPALAPYEIVIVPIYKSDDERARVLEALARVRPALSDRRVKVDDREQLRPGYKYNEWELKGVPLRVEIGPRDAEAGSAVVARRDTGEKEVVPEGTLGARAAELLAEIQAGLYRDAEAFREVNTFTPKDFGEFKALIEAGGGFLTGAWCGDPDCEAEIKAETKATIRFLPLQPSQPDAPCVHCGKPGIERATWALAY